MDSGILVAEGYDYAIIHKLYHPCDACSILAALKADGGWSCNDPEQMPDGEGAVRRTLENDRKNQCNMNFRGDHSRLSKR